MQKALPANPFLRSNPFYVPQKFYSQSHSTSNSSITTSASKYNSISTSNIAAEPYKPPSVGSVLLRKSNYGHEGVQKLVKKGLNGLASPFTRKTLLQNNFIKEPHLDQKPQYWPVSIEKNTLRSCNQFEPKQNQKELEIVVCSPKIKSNQENIELPSPSKQKYLSSELKLKLKSQMYIEEQSPDPITQQHSRRAQDTSKYPSKFKWRGKVFVLRQLI